MSDRCIVCDSKKVIGKCHNCAGSKGVFYCSLEHKYIHNTSEHADLVSVQYIGEDRTSDVKIARGESKTVPFIFEPPNILTKQGSRVDIDALTRSELKTKIEKLMASMSDTSEVLSKISNDGGKTNEDVLIDYTSSLIKKTSEIRDMTRSGIVSLMKKMGVSTEEIDKFIATMGSTLKETTKLITGMCYNVSEQSTEMTLGSIEQKTDETRKYFGEIIKRALDAGVRDDKIEKSIADSVLETLQNPTEEEADEAIVDILCEEFESAIRETIPFSPKVYEEDADKEYIGEGGESDLMDAVGKEGMKKIGGKGFSNLPPKNLNPEEKFDVAVTTKNVKRATSTSIITTTTTTTTTATISNEPRIELLKAKLSEARANFNKAAVIVEQKIQETEQKGQSKGILRGYKMMRNVIARQKTKIETISLLDKPTESETSLVYRASTWIFAFIAAIAAGYTVNKLCGTNTAAFVNEVTKRFGEVKAGFQNGMGSYTKASELHREAIKALKSGTESVVELKIRAEESEVTARELERKKVELTNTVQKIVDLECTLDGPIEVSRSCTSRLVNNLKSTIDHELETGKLDVMDRESLLKASNILAKPFDYSESEGGEVISQETKDIIDVLLISRAPEGVTAASNLIKRALANTDEVIHIQKEQATLLQSNSAAIRKKMTSVHEEIEKTEEMNKETQEIANSFTKTVGDEIESLISDANKMPYVTLGRFLKRKIEKVIGYGDVRNCILEYIDAKVLKPVDELHNVAVLLSKSLRASGATAMTRIGSLAAAIASIYQRISESSWLFALFLIAKLCSKTVSSTFKHVGSWFMSSSEELEYLELLHKLDRFSIMAENGIATSNDVNEIEGTLHEFDARKGEAGDMILTGAAKNGGEVGWTSMCAGHTFRFFGNSAKRTASATEFVYSHAVSPLMGANSLWTRYLTVVRKTATTSAGLIDDKLKILGNLGGTIAGWSLRFAKILCTYTVDLATGMFVFMKNNPLTTIVGFGMTAVVAIIVACFLKYTMLGDLLRPAYDWLRNCKLPIVGWTIKITRDLMKAFNHIVTANTIYGFTITLGWWVAGPALVIYFGYANRSWLLPLMCTLYPKSFVDGKLVANWKETLKKKSAQKRAAKILAKSVYSMTKHEIKEMTQPENVIEDIMETDLRETTLSKTILYASLDEYVVDDEETKLKYTFGVPKFQ
jgi:hypothetical protein